MFEVGPYITFNGTCRNAIEFYKDAVGAEVQFSQTVGESPLSDMGPAENIMHATLKIGSSHVMMADNPSPNAPTDGGFISLALTIGDPEQAKQLFNNLAEGGTVIMPLEKTYWAEAFGMVTDKFGVKWMVNCEAAQ